MSRPALFCVRVGSMYWTRGRFVMTKDFAGLLSESDALRVAKRLGGVAISFE